MRNGIVAENEEDIKYTGSFTIDTIGITDIYAWSTDGGEYQSEETNKEIKIDNKKPVVTYKESSNKEAVNSWYIADVEIQIEGEDEHSGIDCYYYKIQGQNTDWLKRSTKEKLLVTSEGITTIVVKVEDKAGNQSEEKEITIQKDTTAPDTAVISFKSHDKNSITVDATSNDNESGIGSYTFEYRLSTEDANNWKTLANGIVTSTAGKVTYTYSTLAEGEYALRVRIKDKAGNEKISNVIIQTTQLNEAPVFSSQPTVARVSNSNSSLTISAVAQDADGDQLTYTLYTVSGGTESIATGVNQNPITASQGTRVTFTKTGLGNYTTHSFKIKVSDGKEENMSNQASGTTYCLASYCSGGGTTRTKCSTCNGTGSVSSTTNCTTCGGTGKVSKTCGNIVGWFNYEASYSGTLEGYSCYYCGKTITNGVYRVHVENRCRSCGYVVQDFGFQYFCSSHRSSTKTSTIKCPVTKTVSCTISGCNGGKITTTKTCTRSGCVNGYITTSYNCSAHGYRYSHYYCSRHGNSVSQYHG